MSAARRRSAGFAEAASQLNTQTYVARSERAESSRPSRDRFLLRRLALPVLRGAVKRAGGTARRYLAEYSEADPQFLFGDEVLQVVRHERVVTGRSAHAQRLAAVAQNHDAVAAFVGLVELHAHAANPNSSSPL